MDRPAVSTPDSRLELDVRTGVECAVVSVRGQLDRRTAALLQQELQPVLSADGPLGVVVDLTAVNVLDPHGLNILVHLFRHQQERGGWLRLVVFGDRVRRLLRDTGLDGVLPAFGSVRDAVGSFRRGDTVGARARGGDPRAPRRHEVVDLRRRLPARSA